MSEPTEPQQVSFRIPEARILRLAALGCFVADVFSGGLGWGGRVHLMSLGLALWVSAEIFS